MVGYSQNWKSSTTSSDGRKLHFLPQMGMSLYADVYGGFFPSKWLLASQGIVEHPKGLLSQEIKVSLREKCCVLFRNVGENTIATSIFHSLKFSN